MSDSSQFKPDSLPPVENFPAIGWLQSRRAACRTTICHNAICRWLIALWLSLLLSAGVLAAERDSGQALLDADWPEVLEMAKGQTVYFNAWGGSDSINAYLQWVGETVSDRYSVRLVHVKVADIAEIVGQVQAAKAAGRDSGGNVDLMWVNGENFAALKRNELLLGSFADQLPGNRYVLDSPSIQQDFSVPVEGLEAPWGRAQLVFIYDTASVDQPPRSAGALLDYVRGGGRFAYPAPPAFHGTTFIKQLLLELTRSPQALSQPVGQADFESVTEPLWQYLDQLHPLLRGKGRQWPNSGDATRQLLDNREVDIALSFNPNDAAAAVAQGQLPDSVRTYIFDKGTIGNTHFVTIPYNANAAAGAMVVAEFLISAEAQARKADPAYWGDPTILDTGRLPAADLAAFDRIDTSPWALPADQVTVLPEPHSSWTEALEKAWLKRYGG